MKTKYLFEKIKEGHLYLTISGEYDRMDLMLYPKIINEECEKAKIYKVLLNALELKETNATTMDRFFVGEEIANVFGPKIKLAVVWPKKDIDKFAETVAVNRGGNICVFSELETAKKWLLNNDKYE